MVETNKRMNISADQEEQIVNFGALEYDAKKISSILGLDLKLVEAELNNKDSQMSILLQRGRDMADYVVDLKLFDMAKSGDIKALEKLDYRKRSRKMKKM